jgi:ABC-2 type transport system permease protein/lipopolysaccharide transport system permease protein
MEISRNVVSTSCPVDVHGDHDAALPPRPQDKAKPITQGKLAVRDIVRGACLWYIWGTLGWYDIRQRYRRSMIGPFWLTISMGVTIVALGGLYAGLFRADIAQYLPHVAIGFVVWGFISGLINDGCNAFIDGQRNIRQVRLPLSIYVYRVVWRNLIIFGHNLLIVVVVILVFAIRPSWTALLVFPAVVILCVNGVWAGLLLGLLSARFRDVPQIAVNVMQVAFFMTPIIWQPELLPNRALVLIFNPFYHAVELVRMPLVGVAPSLFSWLAVFAVSILGAAITVAVYARYRRRIAYWA